MTLRRRPRPLDPAARAELAAIDAALAGRPVAPEHSALATLVADVRATAPSPSPELDSRLEAGLRSGFAPAGAPAPRGRVATLGAAVRARLGAGISRRSLALGTAGALASVLIAAVVIVSLPGSGSRNATQPQTQLLERAAPGASTPPPAAAPATVTPTPARPTPSPLRPLPPGVAPAPTRRVDRAASLALSTAPDSLNTVADGVVRVTDSFGGIVASSNVSSGRPATDAGPGQGGEASFDLRVPSDRLAAALAALSRLADVTARDQSTQDITAPYDAAASRVGRLTSQRDALRSRLAAAHGAQVQALLARLRAVQAQLALAQRQQRQLDLRARYARVTVQIAATGTRHGAAGPWGPGRALDDALRVLAVAAGVALVALAALVPLAALGLAGWLAGRRLLRRRRERALGFA